MGNLVNWAKRQRIKASPCTLAQLYEHAAAHYKKPPRFVQVPMLAGVMRHRCSNYDAVMRELRVKLQEEWVKRDVNHRSKKAHILEEFEKAKCLLRHRFLTWSRREVIRLMDEKTYTLPRRRKSIKSK
jgi:hypothetical protein